MLNVVENARVLWTFLRLTRDPNRLDLVLKLTDSLDPSRRPGARKMLERPEVRAALAAGVKVPTLDLPKLRALPEGSFGRAAAEFFDGQGLDPGVLHHTPMAEQTDFMRFKQHMERTHDLWHVVTGFATDVPGELGLQAFSIAQIGSPLGYLLLSAGMFHLAQDDELGARVLDELSRGWHHGKAARPFFGVDWEALFPLPLVEVRARMGLGPDGVPNAAPAPASSLVN